MRIFSETTLRDYWRTNGNEGAEEALRQWIKTVKKADWKSTIDAKQTFPSADQLPGGVMIFDILGNHYRLIAEIEYGHSCLYVRFVGTHKEYDKL